MLTVFRIVTHRYLASAFDGEGARLYGGRWNPKGVPVVYTAGSRSLALLEMLVQDAPLRARYLLVPALVPDGVAVGSVEVDELPAGWRETPAPESLRALGGAWARDLETVVLAVPSAVVTAERNYLLNPLHPDFARIEIGEPEEVVTDPRLLRRTDPPPAGGRSGGRAGGPRSR